MDKQSVVSSHCGMKNDQLLTQETVRVIPKNIRWVEEACPKGTRCVVRRAGSSREDKSDQWWKTLEKQVLTGEGTGWLEELFSSVENILYLNQDVDDIFKINHLF